MSETTHAQTAKPLEFLEEEGKLTAKLVIVPGRPPPVAQWLQQQLNMAGYAELFLLDEALNGLVLDAKSEHDGLKKAAVKAEKQRRKAQKDQRGKVGAVEKPKQKDAAPPQGEQTAAATQDKESAEAAQDQNTAPPAAPLRATIAAVIAERRDGEFSIDLSKDEMEATLTVHKAYGGDAVNRNDFDAAARRQEVKFGLIDDAIKSAIEAATGESTVIACGEAPQDGVDTCFENLVAKPVIGPRISDKGRANYHELGLFSTVHPGDPLLKKKPPTKGVAGSTVGGKVIPPQPGKALPFADNLKGCEVSPDDPDLLIASTGGQPTWVERGVHVVPVVDVNDVDLATGNIHFDGNVNVGGDVREGMIIEATGDIRIAGTVAGATLTAGNDIVITKGVVGQGEARTNEGKIGRYAAKLQAGHRCDARFVENAVVAAGGDVVIAEVVAHSEITAGGAVQIGSEDSRKGHVLGGVIRARTRFRAKTVGSPASLHTDLIVGYDPETHARREILAGRNRKLEDEAEKLTTLLKRLALVRNRPDLVERATRTQKHVRKELESVAAELEEVQEALVSCDQAEIIVTHAIYGITRIQIAEQKTTIRDEHAPGRFHLREGEITYGVAPKNEGSLVSPKTADGAE